MLVLELIGKRVMIFKPIVDIFDQLNAQNIQVQYDYGKRVDFVFSYEGKRYLNYFYLSLFYNILYCYLSNYPTQAETKTNTKNDKK